MSEGGTSSHQSQRGEKLAKKRRRLPTVSPSGPASRGLEHPESAEKFSVEKELTRLSPEVLKELTSTENSDKFMPGEIKDITKSEFSLHSGNKQSQITLRSGKKLDISLVEGSFRRITGIREQRDDSGSFLLRRLEIKREPGQSLGFYIREGDGWLRRDGIFVSRVNLGSSVDTNRLLSVGDEIIRVNNVDVTRMLLDDVVLVMQFVKRMILTVKVLTTFGFSSDLSMHKSLLSRELPKPPSLSDPDASGGQGRESSPLDSPEVKSKRDIQEWRLRFQRMKDTSRADSIAKSTNFGESFMKNLDGSSAKVEDSTLGSGGGVVINPYEEVSFDAKQDLAVVDEAAEISPYARVSLRPEVLPQRKVGNQEVAEGESEEISPYARVSLWRVEGAGQGMSSQTESTGSNNVAGPPGSKSEEISPYARVSLRRVEGAGQGESGSNNVSGPPGSKSEEISPYARVSLRTEGKSQGERPVVGAPLQNGHKTISPHESEISPYARVSLRKEGTGQGESVVVEVEGESRSGAGSEERSRRLGGANSYEAVGIEPAKERPNDLYEAVENGSQMRMDSLVALLRAKPVPSSSPAVKRRSDIVDDDVLSPDHIYAQIDRTRKYSSSEEEKEGSEEGREREKGRNISTTTPPPAPTTPLPRDDSMSVLADIFSKPLLDDESQGDGDSRETKSSPSLALHHQEGQVTSGDPEIPVPIRNNDAGSSTGEVLDQLGDEGPAPPLPPPYVPDEGPPDTSDEEEDSRLDSDADSLAENLEASRPLTELPVITVEVQVEKEPVEEMEDVGIDAENFNRESAPVEVSTPIQQPRCQGNQSSALDFDEEVEDREPSSLLVACNAGSLEVVFEANLSSDSCSSSSATQRNMSRHSFSSLPPPPPPPTGPPEDEEDSGESSSSDQEGIEPFTLLDTSNEDGRDGERDTKEENLLSGMVILKVHGLNTTTEKSRTFWSSYDVQKVTFVSAVDERVKVTVNTPVGEKGDSSEVDEYRFLLFKSAQITFSLNSVCLPTVSKAALLCNVFTTDVEGLKQVYVDFESYGRLKLSLAHLAISSVVRRVGGNSYSNPSFSDIVCLNPSNSGCPLVLEQCIEVIERYGLKTPHLYERCTTTLHKHRALAACVENLNSQTLKSVLVRCSVHAYTGLMVDFFQDLPEPFFTNDISSTLTQSASVDGTVAVLESFMLCLPEEVATTLNLLLAHFRRLIEHGERNGVTAKSIARLFGPLLLIPSLSPDLNTSATAFDYAEDYDSQAKVIELLLTRKET